MTDIEKKKKFIINVVYFTLILGLFYFFMKYAFWLLFPFLFGFFVAMILQKPVRKITEKTPIKKGLASTLCVMLALIVVVAVISLIGVKVVSELKGLFQLLSAQLQNFPAFVKTVESEIIGVLHFLPDSLEQTVASSVHNFFSRLLSSEAGASIDLSFLTSPLMGVWNTAKQIPSILVGAIVAIIACCFMTADYDRMVLFIKRQLSAKHKHSLHRAKEIMFYSIGKMVKAYALIMLITFTELCVGLTFLKLIKVYTGGYIVAIAIVVAIVDIIPILGTGTILIPWSIYSFIVGDYGFGIGILAVYGIITVIRQVIEPKLVAGQLGLPPVVTIVGMFIGLRIFGFVGMFLVPLTVILVKLLNDEGVIHIWKTGGAEEEATNQLEPETENATE